MKTIYLYDQRTKQFIGERKVPKGVEIPFSTTTKPSSSLKTPAFVGGKWQEFDPTTVVTQKTIELSKLDFMNLFTNAELVSIYTAAKTDVAVEVWVKKMEAAQTINLFHQDTIDGVNALEANGLLAAGRAKEILAA